MKNIALSDRAYHAARVWAARRDTSLSKIVQGCPGSAPLGAAWNARQNRFSSDLVP